MIQCCCPIRSCGRWMAIFGLVHVTTISLANAAESNPVVASAPSFGNLLQVLLGLGLVLAAIAGTAWLLNRLGPGRISASESIRVVGAVAVGPKERVILVDIGETRLVLGVAPGHVTTLHQMPRPNDEPVSPTLAPISSVFQDKLVSLLKQKKGARDVQ